MVPTAKQTMLFSATMPGPIITLARSFMTQPTHIRAEAPAEGATHLTTTQFAYRAHAMDKVELISKVLQAKDRGLTMIFTRTKRSAQKVSDELVERGFAAAAVHGDLGQGAREQALRAFRSGKVDVLVATDVAARGIDVEDVTHVINYQSPDDDKTYVHRIGRTGRAGRTGIAVDAGRLGRHAPVEDDQRRARPGPWPSRWRRTPTPRTCSPTWTSRRAPPAGCASRSGPVPGLDAEVIEDLGETGRGPRKPTGRDAGRDSGRDSGAPGTRNRARRAPARADKPAAARRPPPKKQLPGPAGTGPVVVPAVARSRRAPPAAE